MITREKYFKSSFIFKIKEISIEKAWKICISIVLFMFKDYYLYFRRKKIFEADKNITFFLII